MENFIFCAVKSYLTIDLNEFSYECNEARSDLLLNIEIYCVYVIAFTLSNLRTGNRMQTDAHWNSWLTRSLQLTDSSNKSVQ